jgi:hypothetical protein
MTTRIYRRTRVRRFQSSGSKWGKGVVHLHVYMRTDPEQLRTLGRKWGWFNACGRWSHGEEIRDREDSTPVTCKRCLKSGWPVPPDWRPTDTPAG